MLNHPVNQLQALPPSLCAHQYGPPAVGIADVSSDIENATSSTNPHRTGQPIEIPIGPPAFQAKEKFVKHPARTEMIVNEMAKFVKPLHARLSSCLYPSSARRCSSLPTWSSTVAMTAPPVSFTTWVRHNPHIQKSTARIDVKQAFLAPRT